MSYFTSINHGLTTSYYMNVNAGVQISDHRRFEKVTVYDKNLRNGLIFILGSLAIADRPMVAEACREIAYTANGNIRKLMEHPRILWLVKYAGLEAIEHMTYGENSKVQTLWTQEDMEAMIDNGFEF